MTGNCKNIFKKAFAGLTAAFLLSLILLFLDSADESREEYLHEKSRVEQALEELTQVINALEYSTSALYPLQNEKYVLPHTVELTDTYCHFGGESQEGEEYDFLFSGPIDMCDAGSSLYQEAYRRMFIAPTMAYLAKTIDNISSVYFLSKDKFIISSPKHFAQSIEADTFDSIVTSRPYWINTIRYGLTQQKDKVVYTGDYEDYLTGEKVITITRGVYIDGEFKGVLALDSYLNTLLMDTKAGYRLSPVVGQNLTGLVSFTFSEPVMIHGKHSGLYLSVDEPKRIHLLHIIDRKDDQLVILLTFYLSAVGFIWYQYTQETQRRLRDLAMIDPMTKLLNRRGFEIRLKQLEEKRYLGIGVFDIDDFKHVNDKYGHEVGDRVIIHTSMLVTNSLRQHDLVARFGGEEFVVAIFGDSPEFVHSIFQRVQLDVSLQGFRLDDGENIQVTISGGAAVYALHHFESTRHIWSSEGIRQADSLLYQAKQQGKNQVVIGDY